MPLNMTSPPERRGRVDTLIDVMCVGGCGRSGWMSEWRRLGDPALRPAWGDERLPGLLGLGQTVGDDDEDRRVVAEAEVAAAHLDVLAERTGGQDRCSPRHDAVGAAVHRGRGDVDWQATSERTAQPDHAADTMRRVPSEGLGVDPAEAPPDQADAPSVLVDEGGQQLVQSRRDAAAGTAVPTQAPPVRAVAETVEEPAQRAGRGVSTAEPGRTSTGCPSPRGVLAINGPANATNAANSRGARFLARETCHRSR